MNLVRVPPRCGCDVYLSGHKPRCDEEDRWAEVTLHATGTCDLDCRSGACACEMEAT